mmetsp:Transcript_34551/g.99160  ORF Transcript_34551/g.99160 Transcript_34551/m.99160 type:complete len:357 (-) Transcript_34551:989-2059(-)
MTLAHLAKLTATLFVSFMLSACQACCLAGQIPPRRRIVRALLAKLAMMFLCFALCALCQARQTRWQEGTFGTDLFARVDHLLGVEGEARNKERSIAKLDVFKGLGPVILLELGEEAGADHESKGLAWAVSVHLAPRDTVINSLLREAEGLVVLPERSDHELVGVGAPLRGISLREREIGNHAHPALVLVDFRVACEVRSLSGLARLRRPVGAIELRRLLRRAARARRARLPMREANDWREVPDVLPVEALGLLRQVGGPWEGTAVVTGKEEPNACAHGRRHREAARGVEGVEDHVRSLLHATLGGRAVFLLENISPALLDERCVLIHELCDLVARRLQEWVEHGRQDLGNGSQCNH